MGVNNGLGRCILGDDVMTHLTRMLFLLIPQTNSFEKRKDTYRQLGRNIEADGCGTVSGRPPVEESSLFRETGWSLRCCVVGYQ